MTIIHKWKISLAVIIGCSLVFIVLYKLPYTVEENYTASSLMGETKEIAIELKGYRMFFKDTVYEGNFFIDGERFKYDKGFLLNQQFSMQDLMVFTSRNEFKELHLVDSRKSKDNKKNFFFAPASNAEEAKNRRMSIYPVNVAQDDSEINVASEENPAKEDDATASHTWTALSEKHYRILRIKDADPLLIKEMQDKDYDEVENALISEEDKAAYIQYLEDFSKDPNATPVDRIYTNGQPENEAELREAMLDSLRSIRSLNSTGQLQEILSKEWEATIPGAYKDVSVTLQNMLLSHGNEITLMKKSQGASLEFRITPDGETSLFAVDNGLWMIDSKERKLEKISEDSYNGKSFEALDKEARALSIHNSAFWNGVLMPSPDSKKVAYISNKPRPKSDDMALFMFDLDTRKETMVAQEQGTEYRMIGWLNSGAIVSSQENEQGSSFLVVDMAGNKQELPLKGKQIYSVQNNLIASYNTSEETSEFYVTRVGEQGGLEELVAIEFKGNIAVRGGQIFSPNNSFVAFIFVPNDEPEARYIRIVDLKNHKVIDITTLPDAITQPATILEFSWINDKKLLVVLREEKQLEDRTVSSLSTWSYSLE